MRAKGFRLLRFNENVEVDFFDRHLLDPVQSRDPNYIKRCINEQMRGTSVTVVLIGSKTHQSEWVDYEIRRAIEEGKGLLGIRLKGKEEAITPARLDDAGGEVIDWTPSEFNSAIERAASSSSIATPASYARSAEPATASAGAGLAGGGPAGCGR